MNILFKSVFIMFLGLFVVSNSVAQEPETYFDSLDQIDQNFLQAVQIDEIEYVAYLLQLGADINATNEFGMNALMLADNVTMLEFLIESGGEEIDVNATDAQGRTAWSYHRPPFVFPPPGSYERGVLLRAGIERNAADEAEDEFMQRLHSSSLSSWEMDITNTNIRAAIERLLRDRDSYVISDGMKILDVIEEVSEDPHLISNHSRVRGDLIKRRELLPEMITYRDSGEMTRIIRGGEIERYVEALIILLRERRLEEIR